MMVMVVLVVLVMMMMMIRRRKYGVRSRNVGIYTGTYLKSLQNTYSHSI